LLSEVYIEGGYADEVAAKTVFDPISVRKRGIMFVARDELESEFAGMIIVVPPDSPSRKFAKENEAEIHLLGVKPKYRGQGLGEELVKRAIQEIQSLGFVKIILWTQVSMTSAQKLYESIGFLRVNEMALVGKTFLVYEKNLTNVK